MSDYKSFKISSFQSGMNEYYTDGIIKPYEAVKAYNCDTSQGSLRTFNNPTTIYTLDNEISSLTAYYGASDSHILIANGKLLTKQDKTKVYDISGAKLDYLNFEYNSKRILIGASSTDVPFLYDGTTARKIKNRRKKYNDEGKLTGYVDANGKEHSNESTITTYAPKGDFIELHYDRLWIAGDKENPDRVYFSTANINGADIEDFTVPLAEEEEINMHGGFLDVRSYDGGKIIAMKVIFNSIVLFKNKTAYKIYGSSPSNYQLVQIFSCNGAIADKSIVAGNNGAYYLNSDGIYFYDGTNTNLVSQKIKKVIESMNKNYANQAVGTYYDNKYYLAIPTGDSTKNNTLIVFDVVNNSFSILHIDNITGFLDYNNEIYYSSENKIKKLFKGDVPLKLYWETPMYDFSDKASRKQSENIYFRAKGKGQIKFTLISETKQKELIVDLTESEKFYKKKIKNKGRMFKLIIENVNNSSFELISPEIIFELDSDI